MVVNLETLAAERKEKLVRDIFTEDLLRSSSFLYTSFKSTFTFLVVGHIFDKFK